MAKTRKSLKGSHILMWSSPLLLGVLVLTLTTTAIPTRPLTGLTSSLPSTTRRPPATTTSVTTVKVPTATSTSTTLETVAVPTTLVPVPTTATPRNSGYSKPSDSTANRTAPSKGVAAAGVVSGLLSTSFDFADVPLQGPGTWQFASNGATGQSLHCGAQSSTILTSVVVGSDQTCQLEIQAGNITTPISWQLTPRP